MNSEPPPPPPREPSRINWREAVKVGIATAAHEAARELRHRAGDPDHGKLVYLATATLSMNRMRETSDALAESEQDYESAELLVEAWTDWFTGHRFYPALHDTTRASIAKSLGEYRQTMAAMKDIRDGKTPQLPDFILERYILPAVLEHLRENPNPEPN